MLVLGRAAAGSGAGSGPAARSNGRRGLRRGQRERLRSPASAEPRRSTAARGGATAGSITCTGPPPLLGEGVRSDLVAAHDLAEGRGQRRGVEPAASAAPPPACCRARLPGSSWSRNQSRCWANESGRRAVPRRRTAEAAAAPGRSRPRRRRPPRPGPPRSGSRRARAAAARRRRPRAPATPPGWRAASGRRGRRSRRRRPTRSSPSTSRPDPGEQLLDRRARRRDGRPRAASASARAPAGPCGPPCRWAVSGSASRRDEGRRHHVLRQPRPQSVAQLRRRRPALAGDHVGDQPAPSPPAVPRHHHRPRARRRAPASAASISPSSMRKPRTLTWWSSRPRNSSVPSGSQRARSPVR